MEIDFEQIRGWAYIVGCTGSLLLFCLLITIPDWLSKYFAFMTLGWFVNCLIMLSFAAYHSEHRTRPPWFEPAQTVNAGLLAIVPIVFFVGVFIARKKNGGR